MDEFRYGDWMILGALAWLGFKGVVAFIQIIVSRPTYCLPASPANHVYPEARRENAGDNVGKGDAGDNGGAALNGDTT